MDPLHQHPQVALLFDPLCRRLFEHLARGPCSAAQLASDVHASPIETRRALRKLVRAGLVATQRNGQGLRYRVDPSGVASLDRALETAWTRRLVAGFAFAAAHAFA